MAFTESQAQTHRSWILLKEDMKPVSPCLFPVLILIKGPRWTHKHKMSSGGNDIVSAAIHTVWKAYKQKWKKIKICWGGGGGELSL